MKVTFILRDLTEAFFEGNESGSIIGLNNMADAVKFAHLNNSRTKGLGDNIKMKIGTGQFRDVVDLNGMLRANPRFIYKLEPRKGYRLATFEITR